jgi:hypothetical protein
MFVFEFLFLYICKTINYKIINMKKIYSLALASIALFGTMSAQQNPFETNGGRQKAVLAPNAKLPYSKVKGNTPATNAKTTSPVFRSYVEPIGDIMTNKGLLLDGSASANQDLFLATVFMDSTVRVSSPTSTRNVSDILMGSVLDLKSTLLSPSFTQIVNSTEGFSIDSIFIPGSYVKVTPAVDTLYMWLAWGDTTQTTVWTKVTTGTLWVAPLSTWRTNVIGSKVTGAIGAPGNKVRSNAPVTNRTLVKYVLTNTDSVPQAGQFKYISIPLPTPINIPANNLVNCFFTFVPGATMASNDCVYAFSGSTVPQNQNGFAAIVWGQTNPALTVLADYVDHQVDLDGYNMGTTYGKEQRHAVYPASYRVYQFGDVASAPAIVYSVYGPNAPVGVTELEKTGVALSQNMPNPFTKESVVRYTLAKDVNSALFTVTDIMGRVITSENVATTTGSHSVKLAAYAAGVYYYSLNVDGVVTTKKMIVE